MRRGGGDLIEHSDDDGTSLGLRKEKREKKPPSSFR